MPKISKNLKDTKKIAKEFLAKLKPCETGATIVGLYGELGTGKTTFTQFVTQELGIKKKVNSPTFVIIKNYPIKNKKHKRLYHMDAYRLNPPAGGEKELLHLGWNEIISNKEHLVFIEWPENIIKSLPKKHHQIHISHLSSRRGAKVGNKEGYRKFQIKKI